MVWNALSTLISFSPVIDNLKQNGLGLFSYPSSFIFPVHKDRKKNNVPKSSQTQSTYNLRYIDDTNNTYPPHIHSSCGKIPCNAHVKGKKGVVRQTFWWNILRQKGQNLQYMILGVFFHIFKATSWKSSDIQKKKRGGSQQYKSNCDAFTQ